MPHLYLLANLFFLSLLLIGWWAFSQWIKTRYPFFLAFYLFLLVAAALGSYATIFLQPAWYLTGPLSLIGFIVFIDTFHKKESQPDNQQFLKYFAATAVLILLLVPSASYLYSSYNQTRQFSSLTKEITEQKKRIETHLDNLTTLAEELAKDPGIIQGLQDKNYAPASTILQTSLLRNNLSLVTLTDPSGTVVSRAHKPSKTGDNLFENSPRSSNLFKQKSLTGIGFNEEYLPSLIAGIAITVEDQTLGFLLLGSSLDSAFIQQSLLKTSGFNGSTALYWEGQLITFPSESFDPLTTNDHFLKALEARKSTQSWQRQIQTPDQLYLAKSESLPTLIPLHSLQLIILTAHD